MSENKKNKKTIEDNFKVISVNKKAHRNYDILDKFEAGIVLTGNEIKSIRAGSINLKESYIRVDVTEVSLIGAHVSEYKYSSEKDYNPLRVRRLLLNKTEINKIRGKVDTKGLTLVPLKIYLKRGKAKLEIALAKGRNAPDKKRAMIDKEKKLEAKRALKEANR